MKILIIKQISEHVIKNKSHQQEAILKNVSSFSQEQEYKHPEKLN